MYKLVLAIFLTLPLNSKADLWDTLSTVHSASNKPNSVVSAVLEKPIDLVGYSVISEDGELEMNEFLLTRQPGSCASEPLPPPNRVVHVKMKDGTSVPNYFGIKIVVHGTMSMGDRFDSSYELLADSVKPASQL